MLDKIAVNSIAAAGSLGVLLGVIYFGGLWWTVSRMPRVRHPFNLYFGSLVVRLAIVLAAFWGVLTYSSWPQLIGAMVGFAAARLLIIRLVGQVAPADAAQRETS